MIILQFIYNRSTNIYLSILSFLRRVKTPLRDNYKCVTILNWRMIIAVNFPLQAIGKKKPEKNDLIFFRLLLSNCLNWKIYCDDHSSVHLQPQYKYELFHIYFTCNDFLCVGGSLLEIARNETLGEGSVFTGNKSLERQVDHLIVYKIKDFVFYLTKL